MRDAGFERALLLGRGWGLTPEEDRATLEDPGFAEVLARLRRRLGVPCPPAGRPCP
jgi:hypothetical protein